MNNLKEINLSNWTFKGNLQSFMSNTNNIQNVILDNVDTSQVTDITGMFSSTNKIVSLDLSDFDTSNLKLYGGSFSGLTNLER